MASFSKNFDFNLRRDNQKISYERCDYESVDEKSLSYAVSKNDGKKNSGGATLDFLFFYLETDVNCICWQNGIAASVDETSDFDCDCESE